MNTNEILEMFGDHVWVPEDLTDFIFSLSGSMVYYLKDGDVYSIERTCTVAINGDYHLTICQENGDRFQAIFDWAKKVDDVYDYTEDGC